MGMLAAIMARVGLDLTGARQGFAQLKAEAKANAEQISKHGQHGAGAHHEHLLASSHRVAHSITGVAQSFLAGGSAADVFAQASEGLAHSLHLPIAALAGLGIGAVAIEKMHEAAKEVADLNQELHSALMPSTGPEYSSMEKLREKFEEVAKVQEKLKNFSFFSETSAGLEQLSKNLFNVAVTGAGVLSGKNSLGELRDAAEDVAALQGSARGDDKLKQQAVAASSLQERYNAMASKEREIADTEEIRVHQSERLAELAKLEAEYRERKGAAQDDQLKNKTVDVSSYLNGLEKDFETRRQAIEAKFAERSRAEQLRGDLFGFQASGNNVAIRSAQARMKEAREGLSDAGNVEEEQAARNRVLAAEQEYAAARKTGQVHKEDAAAQSAIANFVGTADAKHLFALEQERKMLAEKYARAAKEDKAGIKAQLDQNAAAQRDARNATGYRAFDMVNDAIAANTGTGEAEQLRALEAKLANEKSRHGSLSRDPTKGSEELNKQAAVIKQIENELVEMKQRRDDSIESARAETAVVALGIAGYRTLGDILEIHARYHERIAKAIRDGDNSLASQLRHQEQLEILAQRVDQYLETPQQKRADREEARRRKRAERTISKRDDARKSAASDRANGVDDRGPFFIGPRQPLGFHPEKSTQAPKPVSGPASALKQAIDESGMAQDIKTLVGKYGKAI